MCGIVRGRQEKFVCWRRATSSSFTYMRPTTTLATAFVYLSLRVAKLSLNMYRSKRLERVLLLRCQFFKYLIYGTRT